MVLPPSEQHCLFGGVRALTAFQLLLLLYVWVLQLHAQYSEADEYEAHRAVQALQLGQFVQHTSVGCDLVVLTGDFNFRPDQLGYRLIRYTGNLEDAWISRVREKTHQRKYLLEKMLLHTDYSYQTSHSLLLVLESLTVHLSLTELQKLSKD